MTSPSPLLVFRRAAFPLLGLLALLAVACDAGEGAELTPPGPGSAVAEAEIGPAGGELVGTFQNGFEGTKLVVPPGALAAPTKVAFSAAFDATPLPFRAERVGPQVTVLPRGLTLAAPARLTVPSDTELRTQYDDRDEDCKVWVRAPAGDGWVRREPVASGGGTITVEIEAFGTAEAGVVLVPRPVTCAACTRPLVILEEECQNGYCISDVREPSERVGFAHLATVVNQTLYFGDLRDDKLSIVKFPIFGAGTAVTRTNDFSHPQAGFFRRIQVSGDGSVWAPIAAGGGGLVQFQDNVLPKVFDSGSNVHGFAFDGNVVGSRVVSSVRPNVGIDIVARTSAITTTLVRHPALGANTVWGVGGGRYFFVNTFGGTCRGGITALETNCSPLLNDTFGGQPYGASAVSFNDLVAVATASFAAGQQKVAVLGDFGRGPVLRTYVPQTNVASLAFDDNNRTLYGVSTTRPEVYIMTDDGAIATLPLTSADPASEEYAAMLPRAILTIRGKNEHLLLLKGFENGTKRIKRLRKSAAVTAAGGKITQN